MGNENSRNREEGAARSQSPVNARKECNDFECRSKVPEVKDKDKIQMLESELRKKENELKFYREILGEIPSLENEGLDNDIKHRTSSVSARSHISQQSEAMSKMSNLEPQTPRKENPALSSTSGFGSRITIKKTNTTPPGYNQPNKESSVDDLEDIQREAAKQLDRMRQENQQELERLKMKAAEKQRLAEIASAEKQREIQNNLETKRKEMELAESRRQKELQEQEEKNKKAAQMHHKEIEKKKTELAEHRQKLREDEKREMTRIEQERQESQEKFDMFLQYEKATGSSEEFKEWCNQPD